MNPARPVDDKLQNVRRAIWVYFWLLLLEGALRKWALPAYSNPLLIIRDPVLLTAYFLALKAGVFPRNAWVWTLAIIGFFAFAVTFIPLWPYLPPSRILLVAGFGFRANFLHLPLVFLMARVLRAEDVKRFGWWTLALVPPMALLMVAQFNAAPDAFLNHTAGGEGEMMTAALGKVRTAGTFSFVIGVVAYFALATAFLIWGALKRDVYKSWLLFAAGTAIVIGISVSGSRSVVGACAVVVASLGAVLLIRPDVLNRFGQILIATVVLALVVSRMPIFKEGFDVLSTRFTEAAAATDQSMARSLISRVFSNFSEGLYVLTKAPFLGYGLGIGTNAGAKFLTGRSMFLLSEGEWSRVFLENGPILGLGFVIWRLALAANIGFLSLRALRLGNVLPLLLFSSCFLPLMNGQFGQPTVLGFAVFNAGLALAACKELTPTGEPEARRHVQRTQPAIPRRSAYADRLHDHAPGHGQSNGSADR